MYGFNAIWVPTVRAWCGCCAFGAVLLVDAVGLVPPMMRGTEGGTNEQPMGEPVYIVTPYRTFVPPSCTFIFGGTIIQRNVLSFIGSPILYLLYRGNHYTS